MPSHALPVAPRFWSKVQKADGDRCWIWVGGKTSNDTFGYGHISVRSRLQVASRVSYELSVGPIPEGQRVLHRCDNPPCVRPDHLFLGTQADNIRDCRRKGRMRRGPGRPFVRQSHCHLGHELTPDNCYVDRKGDRHCKRCNLDRSRRNYERRGR